MTRIILIGSITQGIGARDPMEIPIPIGNRTRAAIPSILIEFHNQKPTFMKPTPSNMKARLAAITQLIP
jgi:hypothetical protein